MSKYEDYFQWLLYKITPAGHSVDEISHYSSLLSYLFDCEFHSQHPMDKNRIYDADKMRSDFYSRPGIVAGMSRNLPISVLEVLIALAERMNQVVEDSDNRTSEFFWTMINNLGLTLNNDMFYKDYVDMRLGVLYNHDYERDGSGGALFTIHDPNHDMRDADLWYQAMWYLADNV